MADPYTDEELAHLRRQCWEYPPIRRTRLLATIDSRDAAHRQEIAERDARIAELERRLGAIPREFHIEARVRKKKGASWHGRICGMYSTSLTPDGYCVESEREPGSVQIYPAAALEPADD